MTEDRIRELLREMADEPVPPDSMARVRRATAERAESRAGKFGRHWKIAAGILALAAVVSVAILMMREPARVAIPAAETVRTQTPAEVPAPVSPPAQAARRVAHRVPRAVRRQIADTVIRIETEDPDIVIVLVGG